MQGVHHSKVTVHSNAHQEEDAPIQADVFEGESKVAEGYPGGPAGDGGHGLSLLVIVVDSQRKGEDKKQVGSWEADHVDGCAVDGEAW